MHHARLEFLFRKQLAGQATAEESSELMDLMADPANEEQTKELLHQSWETFHPTGKTLSGSESENLLQQLLARQKVIKRAEQKRERLFQLPLLRAAAAVLIMVSCVAALYYFSRNDSSRISGVANRNLHQVSTEALSKTRLELPDGTEVWLHSQSRLVYSNASFGKKNREVTLTGEAYFDVVENPAVPFIIHTGPVNITVKGTAFNVKAYPADSTVETTLVRGLVEITTLQDPERKILLRPNEKITIPVSSSDADGAPSKNADSSSSPYSIVRINTARNLPAEISWIKKQLVFDNESFEALAPRMESWYNIRIRFQDDAITKKRFSGIIEQESVRETLEAMKLSYDFKYETRGRELWIGSK